ncbi:hypothetical protein LX36DRAFT_300824 [Colletotrichum falcatum]|nr:hypothetical protein LX36DRAFT_300824 [Colletotrichum falcatum]
MTVLVATTHIAVPAVLAYMMHVGISFAASCPETAVCQLNLVKPTPLMSKRACIAHVRLAETSLSDKSQIKFHRLTGSLSCSVVPCQSGLAGYLVRPKGSDVGKAPRTVGHGHCTLGVPRHGTTRRRRISSS